MHDHRTRALHHRRHGSAKSAAAVVAVLFFVAMVTLLAPRIAHSASSEPVEVTSAPLAMPAPGRITAAHDIAIETVAAGREGLELSARLSEDGGLIELPVKWMVSTALGEPVISAETPVADVTVKPGDYLVDVNYGAVHLTQGVTLVGGTRLIVSFVLDAGGLRVLPRLRGLGLPAISSRSRIYALSGIRKGTLIATSTRPGEIIRVPAGEYRIESQFDQGNASAVADVVVKPGIMSAVEIDHTAGLARLSFVGPPDADVSWRLADAKGNALPPIEGLSADVVLTPGTYTAVAQIGQESLSAEFMIAAGESRDIILGN